MEVNNSRYSLRKSSSPHRKVTFSPKIQRRKSKPGDEDPAKFDSINVATYNDTPEHMYGELFNCLDLIYLVLKFIK